MAKTRNTKRALLMSALALIMCFAMLIGSTYAWFTDSVTSAGNKIQAGKLDIQLWMYNAAEDKYEDISANADNIFGQGSIAQNNNAETLWEPGKTQVAYFMIKNAGNLNLKYKVALEVENVKKNLYEVMEYAVIADAKADTNKVTAWNGGKNVVEGLQTVTDADVSLGLGGEHYFALAIHMDEEAGNKYQEGIVNFDLTVLATQDTVEEDSFGKDYDKLAEYAFQAKGELKDGESAVSLEARDKQEYKVGYATVPAEAIGDSKKLEMNINKSAYKPNITIAAGLEKATYDVTIDGLKDGNTVEIMAGIRIATGLDPATVKLYHYDTELACTYEPETGYVKFLTATFSPFTVVYDADSKYVPETPGANDKPAAKVEESSEYVNVELPWESYGQWSPTAGLDANLEAAYTFSCEETLEEAKENPYANWYCDFYVMLDKDLGENEIFLGGNYGSFGWVGFHNGDLTLEANTEIGLLESVTTNPWTYLDVVQNVGTFICGVGDVDNALADKDATFTVMLRLTNPENEEDFVNVATITHKFAK